MSVPDTSEITQVHNKDHVSSRSRPVSQSTKSTPEEENREFNKRLLVSLGMLLPALAAIIGVVAWAISAEVVMGAKREAARRHSDSSMRLANKFEYPRFHNVPVNSLPSKEMLIDPKANEHNRPQDNLDFFNQKMEEIGHDLMMRKMDEHKEEKEETNKNKSKPNNASSINDKLKEKLTQENIAQLIEKLLSSHKTRNTKTPQIVVVAPAASQSKNVSKMIATKVTTTKPKAFNLKMTQPKEDKPSSKGGSVSSQAKRKSTQVASVKRRPSSSSSKTKVNLTPETSTKSATNSKSKNYKTKIYEKEIDILLQKIEKLEKQQNVKIEKDAISMPEKVANSELFNGRPTDIADKIKGFLSGVHSPEENSPQLGQQTQPNDWQPSGQAVPQPQLMPPPMPPMPFMPFMPPLPPSYGAPPTSQQEPVASNQPLPYLQPPVERYIKEPMHIQPNYQEYQQVQHNQPPMSPNYEHSSQAQYHRPQHNSEYLSNAASEVHPSQMNSMPPNGHSNQAYGQVYDSPPNGESQMGSHKRKKGSLFGGKFKLSNILNSVIPGKNKKNKQLEQNNILKDNRNIHEPNPPFDPMMPQESQVYPNVDRGQPGMYGEQPGMSINIGGGPIGGGGQVKANPMGFLRSMLPMSGLPKWINGKVVLGIVLENGIGKKPKTIFQHFSTGRIRR